MTSILPSHSPIGIDEDNVSDDTDSDECVCVLPAPLRRSNRIRKPPAYLRDYDLS